MHLRKPFWYLTLIEKQFLSKEVDCIYDEINSRSQRSVRSVFAHIYSLMSPKLKCCNRTKCTSPLSKSSLELSLICPSKIEYQNTFIRNIGGWSLYKGLSITFYLPILIISIFHFSHFITFPLSVFSFTLNHVF